MKTTIFFFGLLFCVCASCQQAVTKKSTASNDSAYVFRSPSYGGTGKLYFGREIASIMSSSGAEWLERSSRSTEENTDMIVKSMKLNPTDVVADIGAGTGYYTFRIAKQVPQGKVYAVEIQDDFINLLKKKKDETGANQVEVVRGDSISVNLPENTVDVAILVDVYHELLWPKEVIASIRKSLKPSGRILLVEYRGEDATVRIKPLHKTTVAQLAHEMKANGFIVDEQIEVLPIQHFIMFKKQ